VLLRKSLVFLNKVSNNMTNSLPSMLVALLIISALIWIPLLFHQIVQRGFLVLLIWLVVAPILSNLIETPGRNPLFPDPPPDEAVAQSPTRTRQTAGGYFSQPATITVQELLEPTRLLFGAFFLFLLGRSLILNKRVLLLDQTETWMLIFCLIALANVILLSNRLAFSARIAIDAFVVPFVAYFTARRFVPDEARFKQFIRAMAYLGCFLTILCLIERLLHPELQHRVQGPFVGRDYLYMVVMVIFFMVAVDGLLQWFRSQPSVLPRWIHYFVGFGSPVIILLTLTRGNWAGFLAGLWIFAFLTRKLLRRRQKLVTVGLSIGLLPIILFSALELSQTELLSGRVANINTIESRLTTYKLVLEAASKNPVFGIGLNNLRDFLRMESHFVEGRMLGTAHSSYLAILAELGIVGLIAYLSIMWSIYRAGLRIFRAEQGLKDKCWGAGVVAMLTAYLVPAFFTNIAYSPLLIHVYLFACIGAIAGRYGLPRVRTIAIPMSASLKETQFPQLVSGK
jgi:O-antigen ligase